MRIISTAASGGTVGRALGKVVSELNSELSRMDGVITKAKTEISAGPSGAYVSISVAVAGAQPRKKRIIGVNERGSSRDEATMKAVRKINSILSKRKGEVVDVYTKTMTTPLPGRAYTTMVVAVNEDLIEKTNDAEHRRRRLKRVMELLENDPSAINISRVAKIFGVSRIVIYKDLEELGYKRASLKKSR
jgi:hypothetical protein